jgi:hypothetical protein
MRPRAVRGREVKRITPISGSFQDRHRERWEPRIPDSWGRESDPLTLEKIPPISFRVSEVLDATTLRRRNQ